MWQENTDFESEVTEVIPDSASYQVMTLAQSLNIGLTSKMELAVESISKSNGRMK